MARIRTYGTDSVIQDADLLLGSDSLYQFETVNFSVGAIKTHVLTSTALSYVPYTGATGDINIGTNNIYTFGGAKLWDDGTVEGTTFQFVNASSSYISASVTANRNWQLPDQSGTIALLSDINAANTLDDVLANGNTSHLDAKVNAIYLYNDFVPAGVGYTSINGNKNAFNFVNVQGDRYAQISNGQIFIKGVDTQYGINIQAPVTATQYRTATFQDADGIVAYLSDIPPGPLTTPTLDEVLTEGNESLLGAKVDFLGIYDTPGLGYGNITLADGNFQFTNSGTNPVAYFEQGFFGLHKTDTIAASINVQLLSASRNHNLPDASGTIALTSDIPAAQVNADWTETNTASKAFILNKPSIATVPVDTTYFTDWEAEAVPLTFDGQPLVTGSYVQTGDLVYFRINVDMDNVTSFGSGQYYMILPFDAKYDTTMPAGHLHDTTTNINYQLMGEVLAGSNVMQLYYATTNSLMEPFDNNSPKILDLNDFFHISGTYIKE